MFERNGYIYYIFIFPRNIRGNRKRKLVPLCPFRVPTLTNEIRAAGDKKIETYATKILTVSHYVR